MTAGSPTSAYSIPASASAWVRSVLAYLFICLYLLLVGPIALLYAYATGRVRHILILGIVAESTARLIVGVRYFVEGLEHVQGHRPAVYLINHRSNVDVLVFGVLYPRFRVLYKAEMGRLPILGRVMKTAGFVPVERQHREHAIDAVETAAQRLLDGDSILLAPEGTRSPTNQLLPFKKGGFVMAIKAQVPLIPVALVGTGDAMPKGSAVVRPTHVRVRIGAPIDTRGLTFDDRDRVMGLARAEMERLLEP
jgi:1-acyl-sn-glycerol-3-phosphate acyltransferase